ncbi:MAG: hypothetical protein QGG88_06105 [Gammaproteobacteria bacterium]|nr:hypothetical protein [Gammaproteobacteria bacterium]
MRIWLQCIAVCSWLVSVAVTAENACLPVASNHNWLLAAEHTQYRSNAIFTDTATTQQNLDAILDVQLAYCEWSANLAYHQSWYEAAPAKHKMELKELVWQSSLNTDLPLDITLGKARIDWGLGYIYQPLDIFRPYQGQSLNSLAEQGTGIIALSAFDAVGEWSLVFSDPSWATNKDPAAIQTGSRPTLGLRHYRLQGDDEYIGQLSYDKDRHITLGAGWTRGVGDSLHLYSSALWQQNHRAYMLPTGLLAPVTAHKQAAGRQFMLGLNWADAVGQTVILEFAYDSRAWSHQQWANAFKRLDHLSSLPGTEPLRQSYALGFKHQHIVRQNLTLHWSFAALAWSNWHWSQNQVWLRQLSPSLDIVYAPQDRGYIATPGLSWQWHQSDKQELKLNWSVRYFAGPSHASYANMAQQRQMLINLTGHF